MIIPAMWLIVLKFVIAQFWECGNISKESLMRHMIILLYFRPSCTITFC